MVEIDEIQKELEMLRMENADLAETNQHLVTATWRERELKDQLREAHEKFLEKQAIIDRQNELIHDSINYAKRLQKAIVPSVSMIRQSFKHSALLYKPKHQLSGDFPWIFPKINDIYIAAVDCTGHGVPGAMLSLIGNFKLHELVQMGKLEPADLLTLLHSEVQKTLNPSGDENVKDGMDVAICRVNYEKGVVSFSGAHRPLIVLDGDELTEVKGSRRAIGGMPKGKKPFAPFENHTMPLKKGTRYFIYSDGLPDQLNHDDSAKFNNKRIKEIIYENRHQDMRSIINEMDKAFLKFKDGATQLDDVLLIGFEI